MFLVCLREKSKLDERIYIPFKEIKFFEIAPVSGAFRPKKWPVVFKDETTLFFDDIGLSEKLK